MYKRFNQFKLTRDFTATELADRMEHNFRDDFPAQQVPRPPAWPATSRAASSRVTVGTDAPPWRSTTSRLANSRVTVGTGTPPWPATANRASKTRGIPNSIDTNARRNNSTTYDPNPTGKRLRKRMRDLLPFPALGEPGGLDDPRRKGLSGAGVRWYLRFLKEGFSPDESKRMADARRTKPPRENTPASVEQRSNVGNNYTTTDAKKMKSSEIESTATTNTPIPTKLQTADGVGEIEVAVLPHGYPCIKLDVDELALLEDAIIEEVALGWQFKLQFKGIHAENGMLLVSCENAQTAEWLLLSAPKLNNWSGVKLTACKGKDIPKAHSIEICLPRSAGQDNAKCFALLTAQNEGLNTQAWQTLGSRDQNKDKILTVVTDKESMDVIAQAGHFLHYKFDKIPIKILKEAPPPPPPPALNIDVIDDDDEAIDNTPDFKQDTSFKAELDSQEPEGETIEDEISEKTITT